MFDFFKSKNIKVLDTSVIIDGRLLKIVETGFIEGDLIVPEFVLGELQALSDSGSMEKRTKGKRGLVILEKMQKLLNIQIINKFSDDINDTKEVDTKLVLFCKEKSCKLLTLDSNLNKIAKIHGVTVLNINDLFISLCPPYVMGDKVTVRIVKPGQQSGQGVGSLVDGTMVIVDGAEDQVGKKVTGEVRQFNSLTSGNMIFAKLINKPVN